MKISACVIARNEAGNIARCLQSVKSIADEMIVVDTGSTDGTAKIAAHLGARVYHFAWVNDFSAARNHALAQAKGDWIIFLDADEYVAAEKARHLRPVLGRVHGNRAIEALTCVMEHTDGFGGRMKARDRTVRIFRNSPDIRYEGKIHEFIRKKGGMTRSAHLEESVVIIRHTGYVMEKRAEKLARNLLLLEASVEDGSANGMTYYYLSHSFWAMRRYEKAIEFARKAMVDGMITASIFAHRVYCVLIQSMLQVNAFRQTDIEPLVTEMLSKFSHHPEVIKTHGYYLRRFGCYTQALERLRQSLAANERYNDITLANEFAMNDFRVHWEIAELCELMGDSVTALEHHVAALKIKKDEAEAFDGLISLVRRQRGADIVRLINSLYDLEVEKEAEFVVTRLAAVREAKLFAYYEKLLAERFGRRDFTAMKFFLSGHYAQAIPLFAAACRESGDQSAELMIALASMLGDLPQRAEGPESDSETPLGKIVASFFRPDTGVRLTREDFPLYMEVVKSCLRIAGRAQLERLLALGPAFGVDGAAARLALLLETQRLYGQALALYEREIEQAGGGPEGDLHCRAGFCCYKLGDYGAAATFFAAALEDGFSGREIGEYLSWSYRRCREEATRNRLASLLDKCGAGAGPAGRKTDCG